MNNDLCYIIGWINDFLSWEGFQPLGRLTYIMYLVHLTVNQVLYSHATFAMTSSNFIGVRSYRKQTTRIRTSNIVYAVMFLSVKSFSH